MFVVSVLESLVNHTAYAPTKQSPAAVVSTTETLWAGTYPFWGFDAVCSLVFQSTPCMHISYVIARAPAKSNQPLNQESISNS